MSRYGASPTFDVISPFFSSRLPNVTTNPSPNVTTNSSPNVKTNPSPNVKTNPTPKCTTNCTPIEVQQMHFEQKTKLTLNTYRTTWKVANFDLWQYYVGTFIRSNNFTTHFEETKKDWYLKIYPFGFNEDHRGYVSLFVYCTSECTASCRLAILDQTNDEHFAISADNVNFSTNGWGSNKFVKRGKLFELNSKLLFKDAITVLCVISMREVGNVEVVCPSGSRARDELSRDLGNMLKSTRLSDLKITAGDREFHVHRAILAARSPVFSAMFEHDLKENSSGTVDVPDISPNVMEALLNFIYTGECPDVGNTTEDLLQVSDKYQLDGLKKICSNYLLSRITSGNAASLLAVADFCNAQELKENVLRHLIYNFKAVEISEGWKSLANTSPSLIREVQEEIVERMVLKKRKTEF